MEGGSLIVCVPIVEQRSSAFETVRQGVFGRKSFLILFCTCRERLLHVERCLRERRR